MASDKFAKGIRWRKGATSNFYDYSKGGESDAQEQSKNQKRTGGCVDGERVWLECGLRISWFEWGYDVSNNRRVQVGAVSNEEYWPRIGVKSFHRLESLSLCPQQTFGGRMGWKENFGGEFLGG